MHRSLAEAPRAFMHTFHDTSRPFLQGLRAATDDLTSAGEHISKASALIGWKFSLVAAILLAAASLTVGRGSGGYGTTLSPFRSKKRSYCARSPNSNSKCRRLPKKAVASGFQPVVPAGACAFLA